MEKMLPQKTCRIDLWYDCILMSPNVSGGLLTEEVVKQSENKTSANIAFYTVHYIIHVHNSSIVIFIVKQNIYIEKNSRI